VFVFLALSPTKVRAAESIASTAFPPIARCIELPGNKSDKVGSAVEIIAERSAIVYSIR
jgi:hypothetical protein